MNIIENSFKYNGPLQKRRSTEYIILHHRAGLGDVQSIHAGHLKNSWSGIGYHFYVRKDGTVYRGRPIETVGAHCTNKNSESIGVCFEGNYEVETMPLPQFKAGQELISYLKGAYPNVDVKRHRDFMATACPGKFFPFNDIIKEVVTVKKELASANDIVWELSQKITISDIPGFVKALDKAKQENSPLYWGYYKIVNK